jgi:hypothetical protein
VLKNKKALHAEILFSSIALDGIRNIINQVGVMQEG